MRCAVRCYSPCDMAIAFWCIIILMDRAFEGSTVMQIGTITRRMKTVTSGMFKAMSTRGDFKRKLAKLKAADPSARPSVCAELCEMFDALEIKCEPDKDDAYYEELLKDSKFPTKNTIEQRILNIMYENFDAYPTPEEYMLRIVNRLSDSKDGWEEDTLRLRILKQFIKYGDYLTYYRDAVDSNGCPVLDAKGAVKKEKVMIYGGEPYIKKYAQNACKEKIKNMEQVLCNIDDGIFSVLENATKAQKKADGTYGILKLADDLAQGKFKAGGATKRELYLFAIVFKMSFYCGEQGDGSKTASFLDYESDIEKNLFEDYYANNLMRFITKAYSGNLSAFERDPSGQGINYKNFAEMIYVYFLTREYSPSEKIRRAHEMIERLKKKDTPERAAVNPKGQTLAFKNLFTEQILELSESEFEAFVADNYDCCVEFTETDKKGKKYTVIKGELQVQTSQQTAFDIYKKLLSDMEEIIWYDGLDDEEFVRENCNYGLWFFDVSMIRKTGGEALEKFAQGKDPEKVEEFIKLLYGINMFLGNTIDEKKSDNSTEQEHKKPSVRMIKAMSVEKPEDMTRTSLVTAYYYYYNAVHECKDSQKRLIDVFHDYVNPETGLNALLAKAHYQPISDKNIFDMAVIFSSYAFLMC